MATSIAQLAFDLSLAAVHRQEARLNELRSRTGTLLAAAAVAASFFGGRAAGGRQLDLLAALAILAFTCCSGASLYVLLQRKLVLEFRGSVLQDWALQVDATVDDVHAAAAEWIDRFHMVNQGALASLTGWYTAAVVALAVEIALWTATVSGSLLA